MLSLPERYAPVSESGLRNSSSYGPLCTIRPPCSPRRRADVHHPVGVGNRVQVVLDDDQRVAEIPQPDQGFDQPAIVPLVQPIDGSSST